jgi:hypothetical protein
MLAVEVGPQLGAAFEPTRAERTVGDQLRADPGCNGRPTHMCFYRNPHSGSVLFTRLDAGLVTYVNPQRRFRGAAGVSNTVTRESALRVAREALPGFALPANELGAPNVSVLMAGSRDTQQPGGPRLLRAELHVRFPRVIAGTPVIPSHVMGVVGADAEIARLYVHWPDFRLQPGLRAERTLSRAAVVDLVLKKMGASNRCGMVARVTAKIAYAPAGLVDVMGEGEAPGTAEDEGYAPALVVTVVPPATAEDSGEIGLAEQQFLVPLLGPAGL